MKKRYSEEQIIGFLRDGEAGIAVKDLCRKVMTQRFLLRSGC
jgi:putative transposase